MVCRNAAAFPECNTRSHMTCTDPIRLFFYEAAVRVFRSVWKGYGTRPVRVRTPGYTHPQDWCGCADEPVSRVLITEGAH